MVRNELEQRPDETFEEYLERRRQAAHEEGRRDGAQAGEGCAILLFQLRRYKWLFLLIALAIAYFIFF
jgi:hypothetical protein